MVKIAVMALLLILPVCDLVTTACYGEGGRRTGRDISGEEGTGGPQVRPSDSLSFPNVYFELITISLLYSQELQPFNRANGGGVNSAIGDAIESQNDETMTKRPLS